MSLSETEREILADAHEDAYSLYEIVAALRVRFRDKAETELRELAASTISSLVDKGYLYICRFDRKTNQESKIPETADSLLTVTSPEWEAPQHGQPYLSILPTDQGGKALFGNR